MRSNSRDEFAPDIDESTLLTILVRYDEPERSPASPVPPPRSATSIVRKEASKPKVDWGSLPRERPSTPNGWGDEPHRVVPTESISLIEELRERYNGSGSFLQLKMPKDTSNTPKEILAAAAKPTPIKDLAMRKI
ncbi:MAG: hypothetical protein M1833_001941 [Piccolia ochrophora]|nr:MAG: hypothetical protein M1833_001941 [Piccolia ochrophora]